ncbi:hypothetical protein ID866_12165 [Astraeus odoratus]|nr:hypothetical protein ID866_12165 [Astraeus odoratus]
MNAVWPRPRPLRNVWRKNGDSSLKESLTPCRATMRKRQQCETRRRSGGWRYRRRSVDGGRMKQRRGLRRRPSTWCMRRLQRRCRRRQRGRRRRSARCRKRQRG